MLKGSLILLSLCVNLAFMLIWRSINRRFMNNVNVKTAFHTFLAREKESAPSAGDF